MVPIFFSIFKDQQVLGVFSEPEIFIFPESDKNIPAASSGLFLLSRINCSEIFKGAASFYRPEHPDFSVTRYFDNVEPISFLV
jgi:hypothetical protein